MAESVLGNVIEFFSRIGIYDVVLPFLLVFVIVYAVLEKTKILGMEKIVGATEATPRKNLNAMVAFVIGFLVVASSQLVSTISQVAAHVVLLILLSVFFLVLVGTFYASSEKVEEKMPTRWKNAFIIINFIALIGIFLNALKTKGGESWLSYALNYLKLYWSSTAVASIIMLILIWLFVSWMLKSSGEGEKKESK
jgi:hypothetical protein